MHFIFSLCRYKNKNKGACAFNYDNPAPPTGDKERNSVLSFIHMVWAKSKEIGIGYAKRAVYLANKFDGEPYAKRFCLFVTAYYDPGTPEEASSESLKRNVKKGSFKPQTECQDSNDDNEDEDSDFIM